MRRITGPIEVAFTDGPSAATHLTRRALHEGVEQIIVVGGDGTTNEVVNGFFEEGRLVNPNALLSFLTCGTGGDFRRTFGVPKQLDAQITGLHTGEIRTIDLGKLTYTDFEGKNRHAVFCKHRQLRVERRGGPGSKSPVVFQTVWGENCL